MSMAYKKVNIGGEAWDFQTQNEIEGIYVAKKENVGPNKSNMYYLRPEEGDDMAVWGSTVIDNQMMLVPLNSKVKITYLGKATSEKTSREYNNFMVEVWED